MHMRKTSQNISKQTLEYLVSLAQTANHAYQRSHRGPTLYMCRYIHEKGVGYN